VCKSDPGEGHVYGIGECGNEPLVPIKCGEFLDWSMICYLLRKDMELVLVLTYLTEHNGETPL
jgi:hypothetical protein